MGPQRQLQTVLCDLDDCLYRVPEMPELVRENIQSGCNKLAATAAELKSKVALSGHLNAIVSTVLTGYMREQLGVPREEVTALCLSAYTNFGTTMAGLVVSPYLSLQRLTTATRLALCTVAVQATGYKIDVSDWHKHVHHVLPYKKYLNRDEKLIKLLQQIQLPMYVFTNGDRKHAEICLQLMGITECFKVVLFNVSMIIVNTCNSRQLSTLNDEQRLSCHLASAPCFA